ncbi:enhanced serine sensitivity protein SseB C-terminal domain-containing protein [Mucilaginibacter sp. FT3.2]|uniref:enhanced serine sensitivity protein SseB C-terminal domain-containing protein n=1 Tax=Mucilaginibacter sp. FT3.2 TaxID=2723090 RepID=UPI00351C1184
MKAAYLGWIHDPASNIPPHYIFAIEETGNWDTLIKELASILKTTLGPKEIVDFLEIDGKKGISGYFINSTTPFYKK